MLRFDVLSVLAILVASALAGCLTDDAAPQSSPTPSPSPTANQTAPVIVPEPPEPTADDWFHLDATAGPGGALTGAAWTIPPGAMHEDEFGSTTWHRMHLELAPLLEPNTTIDQWSLFFFEEDDNESVLLGALIEAPIDVRDRLVVIDSHQRIEPRTDPFFLGFSFGEEDWTNRTLRLVVAAESAEPADFDVAWRILDEPPEFGDEPADSGAQFLETVAENRTRQDVRITGEGTGFHFALYLDLNLRLIAGPAVIGFEATSGPVTVADELDVDTRPMVTVRDVVVSTRFDTPSGWTYALGLYWGDHGAATWTADGDVHGQKSGASGTTAFAGGLPLPSLPVYFVIREGPGGAATSFDLEVADVNEIEIFELLQLSLGDTVENLTGLPAQSDLLEGLGEASGPSVRQAGDDLVFEHGSAPWLRIGGLGAAVHEE